VPEAILHLYYDWPPRPSRNVVEVTAPARIVYIAGQFGIDKEGKLSSDFRLQAVQTFENLKNALAAVRGQFRSTTISST
jgi:enamine deaminase RidA (YjgF/YER057c/UK114 family)